MFGLHCDTSKTLLSILANESAALAIVVAECRDRAGSRDRDMES